jgi:lipopolysaccharide transport system ATP-binding protein
MSDIVISVENLSKRYLIGHQTNRREPYTALRDVIGREARNFGRRALDFVCGRQIIVGDEVEEFWALRDVSFEVKRGEALGIIGRNGAGKSTLLKILSRITEPTEGRARLQGRVASLLEVGTGFHPELTGRENIILNGAILGMRSAEIKSRFDEIVFFADLERFIDTPVKRYSSGMYLRLAFAVAAHLEPEILIVDEVLAVGDAEFQKKCLGKMGEVAQHGRTVLFVSHNMTTVNRLCGRCILLESGQVKKDSDAPSVTAQYLISDTGTMAVREWNAPRERPGDEVARLVRIRVLQHDQLAETVDIRQPVNIEVTYENYKDSAKLVCVLSFFDSQGVHLFISGDLNDAQWSQGRSCGIYTSICEIPGNLLAEGMIRVAVEVSSRQPYQIHFLVFDCVGFQVVDCGELGSVRGSWGRPIPGVVRPLCQWTTIGVEVGSQVSVCRESAGVLR